MREIQLQQTEATGASAAPDFDASFPALFRDSYRVAFRLLGDREEAADVAQEACARACARWARLIRAGDATPWVVRVAANLAIDRWRRLRTAATHVVVAPAPTSTPDRVDLHRALARLSRRQREVILLRYFADLPEADVARELGCAVGTVKTHAARALAALRTTLGEEDTE